MVNKTQLMSNTNTAYIPEILRSDRQLHNTNKKNEKNKKTKKNRDRSEKEKKGKTRIRILKKKPLHKTLV